MTCCRFIAPVVIVAAALVAAGAAVGFAPQDDPGRAAPPAGAQQGGDLFPGLLEAIQSTPGCLGIDAARAMSGKNVIFAWFKDKQSVKKWYYNEMHMGAMQQFFGKADNHAPLADVPDDIGPLMIVASITMSDEPNFEETSLPISQIAIEIYQPVTGGIFLGSRFSPDALEVPKMKDYTPRN
jgi:hypothetical protein